jgi:hypothetical protein
VFPKFAPVVASIVLEVIQKRKKEEQIHIFACFDSVLEGG